MKQKGMTLIGMMMTGIFVIMLGIIVMRVIPVYLQHYMIMRSIESLNDLPVTEFDSNDVSLNVSSLKRDLLKRFEVNNIDENMFETLNISPKDTGYEVTVKYKIMKHLVYNVSLLFDFDDTKEVKIATS